MKKYRVKCYPNMNDFEVTVEAETEEEAIEEAENIANQNCYFCADSNEVEEVDED